MGSPVVTDRICHFGTNHQSNAAPTTTMTAAMAIPVCQSMPFAAPKPMSRATATLMPATQNIIRRLGFIQCRPRAK
jgi:hypothetical protein